MAKGEIVFVIPTYRLRDVGETIEKYDENFWRNGHSVKIMVFDDSSIATHQKYYKKLEQTKTHNDVYYVGPSEKYKFTKFLQSRLKDKNLEQAVNSLFRPSYGGNRNFTLVYTLGNLMISSDDDMRPYGVTNKDFESLKDDEICRGRILSAKDKNFKKVEYDILGSFMEVLGKKAKEIPKNYEKGGLIIDSAMDLKTNTSKGLQSENSLFIQRGKVSPSAIVKIAQTFRSGTSDFDAIDYVEFFLRNEKQTDPQELNSNYVLVNFRPVVTNENWRIDCGVAGYDNSIGLPPFFPTRLRFEDYVYRLWIQQEGIVSAHVNSAQTHIKSNYMRNPLSAEIINEEIANLIKRNIRPTTKSLRDLNIRFDYDGSVTIEDSEKILEKIKRIHKQVLENRNQIKEESRRSALDKFANNLYRVFYSFESDFFQQNVSRIVDDEIGLIKTSMELWPTIIEICYYAKDIKELPQTKVDNTKKQ